MLVNSLSYDVDWRRFKVNTSFFVPCLRVEEGREQVKRVTRRLGFRVRVKPVIEDGIKGLRVWRVR